MRTRHQMRLQASEAETRSEECPGSSTPLLPPQPLRKRPKTSGENKVIKKQKGRRSLKSKSGWILSLPVEILVEIAKHVGAGDLPELVRTCKLFRQVLLRRSARSIWQIALRNVPGLPPCPEAVSEPLYATFLLTKYCTACGKRTDHQPEAYLLVRFCRECRKEHLVGTADIDEERLRELVHQTVPTNGKLSHCLKSDKEAVERRASGLSRRRKWTAQDEEWAAEMRQAREERVQFALQLEGFLESEVKRSSEEAWSTMEERRAEIKRRLRHAGWRPSDWQFPFEVATRWVVMVENFNRLTDRSWKILYPKLVPFLEENRQLRQAQEQGGQDRQQQRRLCRMLVPLKQQNILVKIDPRQLLKAFQNEFFEYDGEMNVDDDGSEQDNSQADDSGSDSDTGSSDESVSHTSSHSSHIPHKRVPDIVLRRPGPPMTDALAMPTVSSLLEDEAAGITMLERFEDAEEEIKGAFDSWSSIQERKLVSMLSTAANTKVSGVPSSLGKRDRLDLLCAVPSRYQGFSDNLPRDVRMLLRADSVFRFVSDDPCPPPAYYPSLFDIHQNLVSGYFDPDEMTGLPPKLGYPWSAENVECYPIGVAAARALLSDLRMRDAAQYELQELRSVFTCERCADGWLRNWNDMVHHYVQAYEHARMARDYMRSGSEQVVYNDIHDLRSIIKGKDKGQPKQLLKAHHPQEVVQTLQRFRDQRSHAKVECNSCASLGFSFSAYRSVMLKHLKSIHEIRKPKAKDYTRTTKKTDVNPQEKSDAHVEYISDSSESGSEDEDLEHLEDLEGKKRGYGSRLYWLDPRIKENLL